MFRKKLQNFLAQAQAAQVIDANTLEVLNQFAKTSVNNDNIVHRVNIITYIIGGVLSILGAILLISYNWSELDNIVKFCSYLTVLIGVFVAGTQSMERKPDLARTLLFIASGLVLAGIGLMAQIYHLSSPSGVAFLLWFILILPTVMLVQWKWLKLMAIYAFVQWLVLYLHYLDGLDMFTCPIIWGGLYMLLELKSYYDCRFLQKLIYFNGVIYYYTLLLFSQDIYGDMDLLPQLPLFIYGVILLISVGIAVYSVLKQQCSPYKYGIIWLLILVPCVGVNNELFHVIWANLVWIGLPILLMIVGVKRQQYDYINVATLLLFIYIITKFLDYFRSMFFSGSMFIALGILLIVIAASFQSLRQKLITYSHTNVIKQ